MSKVTPSSPEVVPEKHGDDMLVTLKVSDFKILMDAVLEAFQKRQQPPIRKIVYPLKEASEMLSVPRSWLAAKARAGRNQMR